MQNPAPGNELIKKANPNMTDAQLAYGIAKMREIGAISGGDAARLGIAAMTDERWEKTAAFMKEWGLLKPETDWRQAYTLQFIKDVKVMP
jgi:NitT/TauT family transport system substrate-binding protein